jgi:hypothetical protein
VVERRRRIRLVVVAERVIRRVRRSERERRDLEDFVSGVRLRELGLGLKTASEVEVLDARVGHLHGDDAVGAVDVAGNRAPWAIGSGVDLQLPVGGDLLAKVSAEEGKALPGDPVGDDVVGPVRREPSHHELQLLGFHAREGLRERSVAEKTTHVHPDLDRSLPVAVRPRDV